MRYQGTVLAALILVAPAASAREERLAPSGVPKVVSDAVQTRFPDAVVKSAEKEFVGESEIYELSIKQNDRHIDVSLTPDGHIVLIETTIDRSKLPEAAANALAERYPTANVRSVEEIVEVEEKQEHLLYYEIELVTADKQKQEVRVTADGSSIGEVQDDDDDGDDDE